jgi:hypothetical protein
MDISVRPASLAEDVSALLVKLGVDKSVLHGGTRQVRTPITGEVIAQLRGSSAAPR